MANERQLLIQQATEKQAEYTKLSQDTEAIQKSLAENETYRALNAMEQRIRHLESVAFHLRDGIKQKVAESDYSGTRDQVKSSMDEYQKQMLQWLNQGFLFRQTQAGGGHAV